MTRDLIVSCTPHETKVALLEDGTVAELFIERDAQRGVVGNIYKGRVTRVLPGMQSAFVELGLERDAFLHAADVFEELDENLLTPEERAAARERETPIEELLREGQDLIVQVLKEPLGQKGARITSHVSLPGRYLVYMPTVEHVGVSRKITEEDERRRLKTLIKEIRQEHGGGGFIGRTAGLGRPREEFERDARYLKRTWDEIRAVASRERGPALLHRELSLVQRLMRDLLSGDVASIRLDDEREYRRTLELVAQLQPDLEARVRLHNRGGHIFDEHGVSAELERALRPKVWLGSGGYIVINQTEALVAVDVNTGRNVGKKSPEETILETNLEAAKEIARQLRLRDLGGIIVVDFIDMDERKSRRKVMETARAGAQARPLALEDARGQRVRPGDHHQEARPPVARAGPLPALPVLHRQRPGQERADRLRRDLGRDPQAGRRPARPEPAVARQPRGGARPAGQRAGPAARAAGAGRPGGAGAVRPAAAPGAVRRGRALKRRPWQTPDYRSSAEYLAVIEQALARQLGREHGSSSRRPTSGWRASGTRPACPWRHCWPASRRRFAAGFEPRSLQACRRFVERDWRAERALAGGVAAQRSRALFEEPLRALVERLESLAATPGTGPSRPAPPRRGRSWPRPPASARPRRAALALRVTAAARACLGPLDEQAARREAERALRRQAGLPETERAAALERHLTRRALAATGASRPAG